MADQPNFFPTIHFQYFSCTFYLHDPALILLEKPHKNDWDRCVFIVKVLKKFKICTSVIKKCIFIIYLCLGPRLQFFKHDYQFDGICCIFDNKEYIYCASFWFFLFDGDGPNWPEPSQTIKDLQWKDCKSDDCICGKKSPN